VEDTLPDFLLMRENDRGYPFTESEIKDQARIFEELQKEKTRVVKVNDLKKDDIGNSNLEKMNKIGKAAGKLSDLQWVLDRFTH
jgi:hypothetical protein